MLRTADYHRDMAEVFFNNNELFAATAVSDNSAPPVPIPLNNVNREGELQVSGSSPGALRYRIKSVQSAALLYSPKTDLPRGRKFVLECDLRIRLGNLVLSVTAPAGSQAPIQLFRDHPQPAVKERVMFDARDFPTLVVMVWANNAQATPADFEIKNMRIWKVAESDPAAVGVNSGTRASQRLSGPL